MLGKIKLIAMDLDGTTLQKDHESFDYLKIDGVSGHL